MDRRMVVAILVGGLTLAACSSHDSLANDQRAVDAAQTAAARDQAALNDFSSLSTSQVISCAVASQELTAPGVPATTSSLPSYCPGSSAYSRLQAKLNADEFKLQVAEDQLKKDESGS
jgi:hypothetical protein